MTPLATLDDLEDRLGESLDGAAVVRAEASQHDASALVRSAAGQDWLADDGVTLAEVPPVVTAVVIAVARRALVNPEGYAAERLGEYSYQRATGTNTDGGVYLTADERRQLARFRPDGGFSTVRFVRSAEYVRRVPIVNGEPL